jgi:hypothetical protein
MSMMVQYRHGNKQMKVNGQRTRPNDFPQGLDIIEMKLALKQNQKPSKTTKHVDGIGSF